MDWRELRELRLRMVQDQLVSQLAARKAKRPPRAARPAGSPSQPPLPVFADPDTGDKPNPARAAAANPDTTTTP
jgi:hypothetical protein